MLACILYALYTVVQLIGIIMIPTEDKSSMQ